VLLWRRGDIADQDWNTLYTTFARLAKPKSNSNPVRELIYANDGRLPLHTT